MYLSSLTRLPEETKAKNTTMDKKEKNLEAVRRFREKERMEKAEREERQRKIRKKAEENEKKRQEIERLKKEVENTRKLLDLRSQALRVQELGQLTASGLLYFRPWQAACNFFEPDLHLRLDPVDLRLQFGTFNQVIYRHSRSE